MKKMLYILMILLGIGTNAFGQWTVVNNSDEDQLGVRLCMRTGFEPLESSSCETLLTSKGQSGTTKSSGGLISVTVNVNKHVILPAWVSHATTGKFSIEGNSKTGFSFHVLGSGG